MIYGIMAIILILFAFLKKSYRTERVKQYPKQWFQFLYPMGLWCYDQYSKLLRTQKREEEKKANAVYIKENASDKLELDIVKRSIFGEKAIRKRKRRLHTGRNPTSSNTYAVATF